MKSSHKLVNTVRFCRRHMYSGYNGREEKATETIKAFRKELTKKAILELNHIDRFAVKGTEQGQTKHRKRHVNVQIYQRRHRVVQCSTRLELRKG